MKRQPLDILSTGLVSSVGLSAAASCAAIRAKVTNPIETGFIASTGEPIIGHCVPLERPWSGHTKLAKMAALAISDCLSNVPQEEWAAIPLLLCVAERERPGRLEDLETELPFEIQSELKAEFARQSLVIPNGRVGFGHALLEAHKILAAGSCRLVLVVASDSLLAWPTLAAYQAEDRLLTAKNSNGFLPGEGAAALLVGEVARGGEARLRLSGLGFAKEAATIQGGQPLRGDGLALAVKNALIEAGCDLQDLDFRITDLSGEQYYFKEAALAMSRVLRASKEEFDIWHPAECIGETGAVAGLATLVVAAAACSKGYAPGPRVLCHAANDDGQRIAAVLQYQVD